VVVGEGREDEAAEGLEAGEGDRFDGWRVEDHDDGQEEDHHRRRGEVGHQPVPHDQAALMAAAIVLGALVGALGGVILTAALRPKRPLPGRQRALLDDAASLLRSLRHPTYLDRVEVLSDPSQQATDRWLDRYNKEFNR
jgi:hypothetical protein